MANMKDKAQDFASQAKDAAGNVADKAKDAASNVADKAKDAGRGIMDTAKDVAGAVRDHVGSAAEATAEGADKAAGWVGSGMENLGRKLHDNAPGGFLGDAAERVSGALESSGKYLQEEGLTGMAKDFGDLIKRNPLPAVLIGIGVGFLLARATSSRS
jgi:ElaB/YqjD/DUF883 family membrane-anchored ribosome-binding protein